MKICVFGASSRELAQGYYCLLYTSPQLDDPDVIITGGSGTLMYFARYPAFKLGKPFVAIPTLASSDGFTANICSVVIDGHKRSIPMSAPALVVADLNIISGCLLYTSRCV